MTEEEKKETGNIIRKQLQEEILAMTIIKRADKKRYGSLQISLKNNYLLGNNKYPTTVPDILKILNNFHF